MLIDWFTVGAQILNFLILVWLLKRFLYKPVLDAIDAREARIAAQIADAVAREAKAVAEQHDYAQKNEAFDRERTKMIGKARSDAAAEGARLVDESRKRSLDDSERQTSAVRADAARLQSALGLRVRDEVFAIARKALIDLSGSSVEERMTACFIERLAAVDGPTKAVFLGALEARKMVIVRTTFDMQALQRAALASALASAFGAGVECSFECTPELVSGIELSVGGHTLEWSIAKYLSTLASAVTDIVGVTENHAVPGPSVVPIPSSA